MVAQSPDDAIERARRYQSCSVGRCLAYVRLWLDVPARDYSAQAAWNNCQYRHPGDRTPPRGAPVFWGGGSHGYGHIALTVAAGNMRSTDVPWAGQVSERELGWVGTYWGMNYLGWTEDLNGVTIPYLHQEKKRSKWASGDVYVERLAYGTRDSDSVARLCYRLRHHRDIPASHRPPHQVRFYGKEIAEAVRYWQRNVAPQVPGGDSGKTLSNRQAHVIFGKNYTLLAK